MSNHETTIHDFDFDLICEYYAGIDRQGPGSPEMTIKALSFIDNLTPESKIADIGCGTGGQTMVLARNAPGTVTAIDIFPTFIDIFNANATKLGLSERVKGIVGNMESLPFGEEELDLIWSEAAIYNVGFERGMKEWRHFLKQGGYIAVTESCWFTEKRPKEIEDFWMAAYPEIDTVSNKVAIMEKAGYVPVAVFTLPENCWIKNFFEPQVESSRRFLEKHPGNKAAEELVKNEKYGAEMYYRFKEYYGYVFYIGRKI